MDTQNSSVVDVPNLKLAKVGKDRDKKRAGGGWLNGGRAGSAFSGATGGAGAGGILGTGMSLGKILAILLVSGGISAGAWKLGNSIAFDSNANNGKSAAPKVFADKDSGKYADTSGVIKAQNTIPNSLGYINNDGLTDEQRAAKKAADEAAAAKAAADAQAKADADAKEKALADAKAASATPDAAAPAAAPEVMKKGLAAGKFGGMNSSFGGGGGGGLSGGAGLSGGINRSFGAESLGGGKGGALSAFRSPSKAATTSASAAGRQHSNAKGFARQQLDMANGLSRSALASGKTEGASAGAASPFDNNPSQGTVISGPGLGTGTQTGAADSGGSNNPSSGSGSGPIGNGAACGQGMEPDATGACNTTVQPPPGQNAAPYQGLIDAALIMIGLVVVISLIAMAFNSTGYGAVAARALCIIIALLGAAIAAMGVMIATMTHGDFMIGGILGVVGGFIAYSGASSIPASTATGTFIITPAGVLIASAIGGLAAMSAKSNQAAMQ